MNPLESNPFAALSLIAAPAVLTNASSVLVLSTSNRFARAIDRARALAGQLQDRGGEEDPLTPLRLRQLSRAEQRSLLLLYALQMFYFALGSFAAASLVSLLGAILATSEHYWVFQVTLFVAIFAGFVGVGGLVFGSFLLVRDTRLAVLNVSDEASLLRERYRTFLEQPSKP